LQGKDTDRGIKPFLWFTLYELLNLGAGAGPVKISTTEFSSSLGCSQQSASRHLRLLEQGGLVSRSVSAGGSLIRITEEGLRTLNDVYVGLKDLLEGGEAETYAFEGKVFGGLHEGAYYLCQGDYREQIAEKLGFDPYPGTLNLRLDAADLEKRRKLELMPALQLRGFKDEERAFGSARCYPALINDEVEGALIVAERTTYDLSVMEIISPIYLRDRFNLEDGDIVRVSISSPQRSSP